MARHCGAMATRIQARLNTVCSSRWLQDWHLSLGLSGARLTHAGAAERLQREYDAVVIGAGHNGLVAAAYLQQAGVRTAVLEKRHVLGGAAVTEEIVPGFKFSRASYLLSLLRPQIYAELELQRHGLRVLPRDPYSFTPLLEDRSPPRSLLLGHNMAQNQQQIAQFSQKDAQAYPEYEAFMGGMVSALDPLLDSPPVDTAALGKGSLLQQLRNLRALWPLLQAAGHQQPAQVQQCSSHTTSPPPGLALGQQLPRYYEVLTAPISKILDQWFESEPLKATLATDAVIGAMTSPHTPGSGYVLLHHVMGELEGRRGAWGYVAGGMGALSQAIAHAATARGAHIFAEKKQLPKDFVQRIRQVDTRSPVTKINVLHTSQLREHPPPASGIHRGYPRTPLQQAHDRALHPLSAGPRTGPTGLPRCVPLHPVHPVRAGRWSVLGRAGQKCVCRQGDILTPPDLERIFGLPGGNIFHGGMSLDQLYFARPAPSYSGYRSPIPGLYLCGSGAHPGGGVMGAAGRNAAQVALKDFRSL
ncbi:pyridine nucleotide-disulfide oxidoreductase domain-containing protein 2 isoform X7 [Pseudopipra pipra]|uniref:pyridine nucleotide-disulfide oxidoreductase domain-containing protein 2 isoform X7 n=1 Tax=Pseudopipra pipra TaxID=415032 RepID=UPI0031391DC1